MHVRLYIIPGLGDRRLDRIRVPEIRRWLNTLANACQCCVQAKDAQRDEHHRKCCAIGKCCDQRLSRTTIESTRAVLRRALNNAIAEELITRNPVELVQVPSSASRRKRQVKSWSVEEARRFLEAARTAQDPLYAAYTLILVTGLRRGEVLGLSWDRVDLKEQEVLPSMALQRVNRRLVLGEAKTEASEEPVPLPEICTTALRLRRASQEQAKRSLDGPWPDRYGLVFTTRYGQPIEPRNFNRSFAHRCEVAGVRKIRLHDTRHTCGSLLAAMDVHPRVAMQILRHSKIDVTMEIYTHVPSEVTRAALRKLADSLGGEVAP
ncbi:site-specific integrase [Actinopolymorpha sp. B17G11]|uniref:tyrosine-type recombinase/integrase n=1 Tax=Actinopolymorpha sp. B17G11 TaxID=3160861 RepID=UPI0032E3F576